MNVLFVMSDSLTPHLTGPYGDRGGSTPNLDNLASDGVVFENAYCNSPLCVPSRASMVTGRFASDLMCYDNASAFSSEWPTFGHSLAAAGYETTIIGKMHFVGHDQNHGFDSRICLHTDYTTGYDPLGYLLAYDWTQPSGGNPAGPEWMGTSYVKSEEWDHYPKHYDWDEEIHNAALEFLSGKSPDSDPFFCCVSYHQPHNPFWIPDDIRDIFRSRELPLPSIPDGIETCHGPMDRWLDDFHYLPQVRGEMMDEENLRWLYETYYGMTYDMDSRLGELLQSMKETGIDENTAVIFASDHGDMMAHRGMLQKRYFYERSVRVALVLSYPGQWATGARIEKPVSLVDIFPTLSEITGAQIPPNLAGRSLLPCIEDGHEPEEETIFCEYHGEGVHAPCFMARRGDYKYVYVHGHEERLYNVEEDPDEYRNLIEERGYADVAANLRKSILNQFDPDRVSDEALRSQRNRGFIYRRAKERDEAQA